MGKNNQVNKRDELALYILNNKKTKKTTINNAKKLSEIFLYYPIIY